MGTHLQKQRKRGKKKYIEKKRKKEERERQRERQRESQREEDNDCKKVIKLERAYRAIHEACVLREKQATH